MKAGIHQFASKARDQGVALLIVLAFVVLLTGVSVAYLSRTTAARQVVHSSFNDSEADDLARSALHIIVNDLRQEIINGSIASTANGYTIYSPTFAANMVPQRSGTPPAGATPIPNLIRRSIYPNGIAPPGMSSRASNVNSTAASMNGRVVSTARWNRHYLVPRVSPTPSSDDDATPTSSFVAPDWVLVTRNGPTPVPGWTTSLRDPTPTNENYVVGRYAYAVYDEGGLIDANVAGYPSPAPSPPNYAQTIGRKGYVSFADLTQTGMSWGGVGDVVGWRNYASIQPGGMFTSFTFDSGAAIRYVSAVFSNSNGFTSVRNATWNNRTDQVFINRQSLLQLRKSSQFTVAALQYLGTFSRELNRPSWTPATISRINPDLGAVRVTSSFTRLDGTAAIVGEPLLKTRFSLRRLSWLTYKGPSANRNFPPPSPPLPVTDPDYDMWQLLYTYEVPLADLQQGTVDNIKRVFGLVWDTRAYASSPRAGFQWVYVSPSSANSGGTFDGIAGVAATVVKDLSTVQTEAREPDFFEILKAVISNGSVGLGTNADSFVKAYGKYYDTTNGNSANYQLVQIGANIMDASDADNVPTWINFNGNEATGIENLPYLNKLVFMPGFASGANDFFDAWLIPSLWNPHQNAPGTGTIRIALNGTGQLSATGTAISHGNPITTTAGPIAPLPASMDISGAGFGMPSPQTGTPLSHTSSVSEASHPSTSYWGFHFPFTIDTPNAQLVTEQDANSAYPDFGAISGASTVELQILIPGTTIFVPYQAWTIAATAHPLLAQGVNGNFAIGSNKVQDPEFVALDPRTIRFGVWGTDASGQGSSATKDYVQGALDSLDEGPQARRLERITMYSPQNTSYFTTSAFPSTMYLFCTNSAASDHYLDLDNVQRRADWTTDTNGTGNQKTIMFGPNQSDRPQIPSRPFQSVAELGQVFRDQPWKTLAFTIANTGDAGLLDVFTLQDAPVIAGKASLNTRQSTVVNAILSRMTKTVSGSSPVTAVSGISSALVNLTSATPMVNKGEIVTRLSGDASVAGLGNKEAREAIVRALSDATQTRTWDLMIDVIAQSGRYPPNASDLSHFVVEGEQRYWLHVAIDRFTGEIIDQQMELVNE